MDYVAGAPDSGIINDPERYPTITRDLLVSLNEHPEIRARAYASLNGRRSRPRIDPTVDLAKAPRSLAPKEWILPLGDP